MPVRNRRPEDEQPLIRAVHGHQLVRPVGGGQGGASQAGEAREEPRGDGGGQAAPQAGAANGGEKGPIARAMDKAQENNWVYGSVANKARETGLLDKADKVLGRLTGK